MLEVIVVKLVWVDLSLSTFYIPFIHQNILELIILLRSLKLPVAPQAITSIQLRPRRQHQLVLRIRICSGTRLKVRRRM